MKLLIDTHAFIWFVNGDKNLSSTAKKEILKEGNVKYFSIASIWELAIKNSLGKLKINRPFKEIYDQINENGFNILPIIFDHLVLVNNLDFHHRDPFDRLLISQAISEDMTILTKDDNFRYYKVKTTW